MTLTTFLLSFSHFDVISIIMLFGCFWLGNKTPYHLFYLILFSLILNVTLKTTFQIPLAPSVGKGFAFPSGHMQLATVFYLGLTYKLKSRLIQALVPMLLAGVGWGLINAGYHNLLDVCGGIIVGYCLVSLYNYLLLNYDSNRLKFLGLLLTSIFMSYIHIRQGFIPNFAVIAYLLMVLDRSAYFCYFNNPSRVIHQEQISL